MVSVSSLVLIVDFIRLVAFRLFSWDELHCDLCNSIFEEGARLRYVLNFFGDLLKTEKESMIVSSLKSYRDN